MSGVEDLAIEQAVETVCIYLQYTYGLLGQKL